MTTKVASGLSKTVDSRIPGEWFALRYRTDLECKPCVGSTSVATNMHACAVSVVRVGIIVTISVKLICGR